MIEGKRRPRFRRVLTRGFRLTPRDLAIIRQTAEHRLLDSNHLTAILGEGNAHQVRRRLQLLYHGRYLNRPAVQVADFYQYPGSKPMVYAPGIRGAEILAEAEGATAIDWAAKNRTLRPTFYHHTLMVSFEVACRLRGNVRLTTWEKILAAAPETTRRKRHPQTWQVRVPGKGALGIAPHQILGLRFLDRPAGQTTTYFFLEADRATMPVFRSNLNDTSFYRKMLGYHTTASQEIHTKHFGIKAFRVLTVTRSPDRARIASMVQASQKLRGLQGFYVFADQGRLLAFDPLAQEWVNGRGEGVALGG